MVFKYSSNTCAKGTGESWSSFEFTFILGSPLARVVRFAIQMEKKLIDEQQTC